MLKIITITIFILKNLLYSSSDEYCITSYNFNIKKFVLLIIVVIAVSVSYTSTIKIVKLAQRNIEMQVLLKKCKQPINY